MDISKEFIEMCSKAVKLRENWIPRVGDSISLCLPNYMNGKDWVREQFNVK